MKIKAPTGYARLRTAKEAGHYAACRLYEGCEVHIAKDSENMYRVDFKPEPVITEEVAP